MIPERIPTLPARLEVEPRPVRIAFSEEGEALSIKFPPLADEKEMEQLAKINFSLSEHLDRLGHHELADPSDRVPMMEQMTRFKNSPVYWNRLADFNFMEAGIQPVDCLDAAIALSTDPFLNYDVPSSYLPIGSLIRRSLRFKRLRWVKRFTHSFASPSSI